MAFRGAPIQTLTGERTPIGLPQGLGWQSMRERDYHVGRCAIHRWRLPMARLCAVAT